MRYSSVVSAKNLSLDQVNKSGYALQIALAHSIRAGKEDHGWTVSYEEHAWRNSLDDSSGFLDLILGSARYAARILIECKRLQGTTYTFLTQNGGANISARAKTFALLGEHAVITRGYPSWQDYYLTSKSPEVAYCVVRKGSEKAGEGIIERVGTELVSAAEAFEQEERDQFSGMVTSGFIERYYFTAIVTTAQLEVCSFDPTTVSLEDGLVPSTAKFELVNYVRFRKQLTLRTPGRYNPDLEDHPEGGPGTMAAWLAHAKERTVFVIRAAYLTEFLESFGYAPRRGPSGPRTDVL